MRVSNRHPENSAGKRNGHFGEFDPMPLLRQLVLALPDLRRRPDESRVRDNGMWDCTHHVTDRQIAEVLDVSVRTVQRWKHGGLLRTVDADRLAVRIGLDAPLLWPDWYEQVPA